MEESNNKVLFKLPNREDEADYIYRNGLTSSKLISLQYLLLRTASLVFWKGSIYFTDSDLLISDLHDAILNQVSFKNPRNVLKSNFFRKIGHWSGQDVYCNQLWNTGQYLILLARYLER
jgi:hypothetical protein